LEDQGIPVVYHVETIVKEDENVMEKSNQTDEKPITEDAVRKEKPVVVAEFCRNGSLPSIKEAEDMIRVRFMADAALKKRTRGVRILMTVCAIAWTGVIILQMRKLFLLLEYKVFIPEETFCRDVTKTIILTVAGIVIVAYSISRRSLRTIKGLAKFTLKQLRKKKQTENAVITFYETHLKMTANGIDIRINYAAMVNLYKTDLLLAYALEQTPKVPCFILKRDLTEGDFEKLITFLEDKTGHKAEAAVERHRKKEIPVQTKAS